MVLYVLDRGRVERRNEYSLCCHSLAAWFSRVLCPLLLLPALSSPNFSTSRFNGLMRTTSPALGGLMPLNLPLYVGTVPDRVAISWQ